MVLGDVLQEESNKDNAVLQAIYNILTGAPINEAGNGSPSSLQAALKLAIESLQLGDYSNINSDKSFLK